MNSEQLVNSSITKGKARLNKKTCLTGEISADTRARFFCLFSGREHA